jgi:ATP-dependent helicase HrpB
VVLGQGHAPSSTLSALRNCCLPAQGLSDGGWASLPVPAAAEAWRARAAWLHSAEVAATGSSSLPNLSCEHLLASLDRWLGPHLSGLRSKGQLQKLPWLDVFKGQVSGEADLVAWCG